MATRRGSGRSDVLRGTDLDDLLYGLGGNDKLFGYLGDDVLVGHGGHDRLVCGDGNDRALGGSGNDKIYGGNGDDNLQGGNGNDYLNGGDGWNVLVGGNGNDRLYGGNYDDNLQGGNGNDVIYGYDGADCLHGLGNGKDKYFGGDGNDTIECGTGTTLGDCGSGDDLVYASLGVNNIRGGEGEDTVTYLNVPRWGYYVPVNSGVVVNLVTGTGGGSAKGDRYSGIENVIGSAHDDRIYLNNGGSGYGGDGSDWIGAFGIGVSELGGGNGLDTLAGNLGQEDHFLIENAMGADSITGFEAGRDFLKIALGDFGFGAALDAAELVVGPGPVGSGPQLIFDGAGKLYYDADGTGAGGMVLLATLSDAAGAALTGLTLADFII